MTQGFNYIHTGNFEEMIKDFLRENLRVETQLNISGDRLRVETILSLSGGEIITYGHDSIDLPDNRYD